MTRAPSIVHYLLAALVAWLPLQAYAGGMPPAGGSGHCAAMAMQGQYSHHGHHPAAELSAGQGDMAQCQAGCGGGCDHCAACTHGVVAAIAAGAPQPVVAAAATPPDDVAAPVISRSPVPRLRPPRHA